MKNLIFPLKLICLFASIVGVAFAVAWSVTVCTQPPAILAHSPWLAAITAVAAVTVSQCGMIASCRKLAVHMGLE